MKRMIEVESLAKRFGYKTVLRDLDFKVQAGELVALLGPNGSGKTTLLRILASLSRPTAGRIRIAGVSLPTQAADIRRSLGVVLHLPLLYADLTARENLVFYGRMCAVADLKPRVEEVLELTGLASQRDHLVRTFSRGMQQRLAMGRALLHDPEILLLDEPYTGLDPEACELLDCILEDEVARSRTVVLTSHEFARVERTASRFDVLFRGRIAASTTPAKLGKGSLLDFYHRTLVGES